MVTEVYDLEKLSKDEDFREQLESAATQLLKTGKAKGWSLNSISFSEDETNGGRSYVSAQSKGKFDGKIARFYATCVQGICTVSSVSFTDPQAEKNGLAVY